MKNKTRYQAFVVLFMTVVITLNLRMLYHGDGTERTDDDCDKPVIINIQSAVDVVTKDVDTAYLKWPTLNASHTKMLGYTRPEKGFITIGIPSIKRIIGLDYLIKTISSLSDKTTSREKLFIVIVVFLADFDVAYNEKSVKTLSETFKDLIAMGFLQIVQASTDYYPSFEHLKHNFNDNDERVKWRSKQVLDFSFMFMYSQNISEYYLQLEDDVICAANFVDSIKSYISFQKRTWAMLEFSELGFIGKLFRTADLPKLARFMLTFYQEQPIDWLLTYFRLASTQNEVLLRKPTLFQHIGIKSSFDITSDNKLKDRFFDSGEKKWRSHDPPGKVYTNMDHHIHFTPELCYASGSGFFWAKDPKRGDHLTVRFDTPQKLKRIVVETGHDKYPNDKLQNGRLEVSPKFMKTYEDSRGNVTDVMCADWRNMGDFVDGRMDTADLSTWNKPMECLRIRQTQDQDNWIVFDQIAVFIYL